MVHAPLDPIQHAQAAPFVWLEAHLDPAFVLDPDLRVVQINAALRAHMTVQPDLRCVLMNLDGQFDLLRRARAVLGAGCGERFDWQPAEGLLLRAVMNAWDGHVFVYLQDTASDVRVRRLERLDEVTARLSRTLDPAEVVREILGAAVPLLGAERGAVFTVDPSGTHATLQGLVGFTAELEEQYRRIPLVAPGEDARRFLLGEVLLLDTHELEAQLGVRPPALAPPGREAIVPLMVGEAPVGALSLSFASHAVFSADDLTFMRTVAARCAQALRRAHLAQTLQYERERVLRLVEATAHSVWWTGPQGETYQASRSWEAFTGQAEGASLGEGWLEAVHPDDREATRRGWKAALERQLPYETQFRLRRHDGEYRVMRVRAVPVWHHGVLREWVGMDEDITERVLAEEQLRTWSLELQKQVGERTADLQRTLDGLRAETDALRAFTAFTEAAGREQDLDALARRAVEALAAAVPGSTSGYLVPGGEKWVVQAHAGPSDARSPDVLGQGFPISEEFHDVLRSGEVRFMDHPPPSGAPCAVGMTALALAPVRCSEGPLGLLAVGLRRGPWDARDRGIVRAVTQALHAAVERTERERTLRAKQVQTESLNAELDAFAQTVSHDLRAPVRHVRGFADLALRAVRGGKLDAAARHLEIIQGAAEHANVMIDALLGLGRQAQTLAQPQDVPLDVIVSDVRAQLTSEAGERAIEWRVDPLPVVRGDPALLRVVFVNLLGNAVKYTRGVDHALVEVTAHEDDGCHVLRVRDNGAGFDARYAHRLFQPFQRLHRDSEFEGTGVGLTSVARIVRRHGGTVSADGQPGKGATFTVRLPR